MLATLFVVLLLAVVYWFTLRRWFGRWGATNNELCGVMSGDAIISHPTHSATQALTVNAPPTNRSCCIAGRNDPHFHGLGVVP